MVPLHGSADAPIMRAAVSHRGRRPEPAPGNSKHMRTTTRRVALVGALSVSALLIAACGGGTTSSATPTDAAATADAPTTAPATTAPSDAAPTAAPSDAIVLPSFDPSAILENLEGIDSYRIALSSDGEVQYSAVVVTKPVLSRDITIGSEDDAQRIIVIGDEAWMSAGDSWEALPPGMSGTMLAAFDPILLAGGFAQQGAWTGAADQGVEDRNGVQARHYRIDSASIVGVLASMPPGASIDAWVSEDGGFLVALEVVNEDGEGFKIDVTDINDPTLTVEAPV